MLSQRRYRGVRNRYMSKGRILQGDPESAGFEAILSTDRFARYLAWAGGDRERALELYRLNVAASEALYTPLHVLEVALRNRIHALLSEERGEHWFDTPGLLVLPNQHRQLGEAKARLLELRRPIGSGRIVAALTFGFWVAMLSPAYEILWQKTLHRIARREDGRGLARKALTRAADTNPRAAQPRGSPRADHRVGPEQAPRQHPAAHDLALACCRRMAAPAKPVRRDLS